MLGDLIVKNKVDIMTTTPTYLSNMIDLPQLQEAAAQIKVFDVGAEAFPPALFDKIRASKPGCLYYERLWTNRDHHQLYHEGDHRQQKYYHRRAKRQC